MNHVIRNTQSHVKFLVCLSSLVVEVYLFWLFHILEFLHHFGMEYLLAGLIASNLPKKSSSSVPAGSQKKSSIERLSFFRFYISIFPHKSKSNDYLELLEIQQKTYLDYLFFRLFLYQNILRQIINFRLCQP